jgi:hypothetical protein
MDMVQVLVSIFVGLGALAGIVKWGVQSYFDKVSEIEKMKENQINSQIKELNKSTVTVKNEVTTVITKVKDFEISLQQLNHRINDFERISGKIVADQVQILNEIKNRPKVIEDYDFVEIKKDLFILKKRKLTA